MIVGVLKEIKPQENRVSLTPVAVKQLVKQGHAVFVEIDAGKGSGYSNEEFLISGAKVTEKKQVLLKAVLLLKVKEPQPSEYLDYKPHHIIFTFLHLASNKKLTEALLKTKATFIAYEAITAKDGSLPLLVPMSQIAGRLSIQIGADLLLKHNNGAGVLLGGVPGVSRGKVVILGGGIVGEEAAKMAAGLGAQVSIIEKNTKRLLELSNILPANVSTYHAASNNITKLVKDADLVIGAVLIPNGRTPILVNADLIKSMRKGSVVVDVAVDQGGCIETSEVTSHLEPVLLKHGVLHYGVPNMPGAVPKTSTEALVSTTLPYIEAVASEEIDELLTNEIAFADGLAILRGVVKEEKLLSIHDLK
jgi:alanine dehydrogenase